MTETTLYLGIVLILFGLFKYVREVSIYKRNETIEAEITQVKEKIRRHGRYSYPKVKVMEDSYEKEFYCYSAKVSGHDKYYVGQTITLYQYRTLKGDTAYLAKRSPYLSLIYAVAGAVALIYYFFV